MQLERCLMILRKGRNVSGLWSGRPSFGSRAWRWMIAAPASAAPMAASAISSGVTGRCGDIDGVWIDPVTAQVMITLRAMHCAPELGLRPQHLRRSISRPGTCAVSIETFDDG